MSERMSRVNVSCNDIPNVAVAMQMLQNATKCCPKKVKLPSSNGSGSDAWKSGQDGH